MVEYDEEHRGASEEDGDGVELGIRYHFGRVFFERDNRRDCGAPIKAIRRNIAILLLADVPLTASSAITGLWRKLQLEMWTWWCRFAA